MNRYRSGAKPHITETAALEEMVADLKGQGMPAEEIHCQVVRIALVDLDDLNALLKAA